MSGDNFTFGDQNNSGNAQAAMVNQGEMVQNIGGSDPWQEVESAVNTMVEEGASQDQQREVQEAVDNLKELSQHNAPPISEWQGVIDTLRPYKGIANLALKAVKLTPGAEVIGPALEKMIEATA